MTYGLHAVVYVNVSVSLHKVAVVKQRELLGDLFGETEKTSTEGLRVRERLLDRQNT